MTILMVIITVVTGVIITPASISVTGIIVKGVTPIITMTDMAVKENITTGGTMISTITAVVDIKVDFLSNTNRYLNTGSFFSDHYQSHAVY